MRHTVWLPTFGFKLRFNVAKRYIVVDQHERMAVVEDYIADSDDEDPAPSEQAYINARRCEPARDVPAKCTHTLDASIVFLLNFKKPNWRLSCVSPLHLASCRSRGS
jgi:hypothetical protein